MIQPIVEFFKLEPIPSKFGKNFELFPTGDKAPRYNKGLHSALKNAAGVYIFFDSRGEGVYAGQASKDLWSEMRLAYNKELGQNPTRKVNLVRHPPNSEYKPWIEQKKYIKSFDVKIRDISAYFSAYEVDEDQIDDVEALLIRVFSNSMVNLANPSFGKYERKTKKGKPKETIREGETKSKFGKFRFSMIGILPGSVLMFKGMNGIRCEVFDDGNVIFEGEEMSLSKAAKIAYSRMGKNWRAVSGPASWLYGNPPKTLAQIREEMNF